MFTISRKVGFVSSVAEEKGRRFFEFKTSIPDYANKDHEGALYGTELSAEEKVVLIEHLETF